MLSVVIPSFNEKENIVNTARTIEKVLGDAAIAHEIIFVDDGSRDGSMDMVRKIHQENPQIKGIHFSRNFGKEAAISAGLHMAKGECAVVLDCDLQHPPQVIVEMYRLWEQGYDIVEGLKSSRGKENVIHKICAKLFYKGMNRFAGFDMGASSDFKLISREIIDILISLNETNLFFRALTYWVGFKTTSVSYEVQPRVAGDTKWSGRALAKYAVRNMTMFSTAPLQIISVLGVVMLLLGLLVGIDTVISFARGEAAAGVPTVILLLLIIGGCLMLSLGIIGLYIGSIYQEVKHRPVYLVQEKIE